MVKTIYSIFLGILLSIFIGVGVSVFYPQPTPPEEPEIIRYNGSEQWNEQQQAALIEYEQQDEQYQINEMGPYNRNVSLIVLSFALIFIICGVVFTDLLNAIADGLLFGGIFTLIYGLGRGLAADSDTFRFLVITICLLVVIGLGYWKFIKPTGKEASSI